MDAGLLCPTTIPPSQNPSLAQSPCAMAMKRKLEYDAEDVAPMPQKQLKLIPFPNFEVEGDVAMMDVEPLPDMQFHLRLPSNASSASSSASDSPLTNTPPYPTFDLYPLPFFDAQTGMVDNSSHTSSQYSSNQPPSPQVGLIQPSSGFAHHGSNCTQIPKLRMACASGVNGQRTMWSHCEQCGAISMVDCD